MPEEMNRLVTDRLSDLLFAPDRISGENLRKEGVTENRIQYIERIKDEHLNSLKLNRNPGRPELWDGKTAQRIVKEIINY